MNLLYIANIRLPTEKAHGIQIMKMCEFFSKQGIGVELVVPWRFNHIKGSPFIYYRIEEDFIITRIPSLDLIKFGRIGFLIQSFSFSIFSFLYSIFKKVDVIYSRDELPLLFLGFIKKNIVYEAHTPRFNFIIKRFSKIVAISNGLKQFYTDKDVLEHKIIVAPDAVDIKEFDISISKIEARNKLNLPLNKKIILYTGHLYGWKGVDTLAECSKYLREDETIIFVGGVHKDVIRFKEKYKKVQNIIVLGQKLHKDIPYYLKSADVLALPNSGKSDVSKYYTSPMKLFEYMASETPIVASDLPSLREVISERNAFFAKADNPKSFAHTIQHVLEHSGEACARARQARKDVEEYTWEKRAEYIAEVAR